MRCHNFYFSLIISKINVISINNRIIKITKSSSIFSKITKISNITNVAINSKITINATNTTDCCVACCRARNGPYRAIGPESDSVAAGCFCFCAR